MRHKPCCYVMWAVIGLALAMMACSVGSNRATRISPSPTSPLSQPTAKPTPVAKPTRKPASTTPSVAFYNLEFASEVISDTEGLYPQDPGTFFSDLSEINAVWEYQDAQDGADFRRVWSRDGETLLDTSSAWDGGEHGTYHLSASVESGTLDPGQYMLELYYDGELVASGEFEVVADGAAGVLYRDDFEDADSGWDVSESENSSTGYEDGKYVIAIEAVDWFAWANPNQDLDLADVSISVEAKFDDGPQEAGYGLICRYQDTENFYYFTVQADGRAGIFSLEDGVYTLLSTSEDLPELTAAVKRGKATNRLTAICAGGKLELYVNDQLAAEAEDDTFSSGDIGLIGVSAEDEGGLKAFFDNIVVTAPSQ